VTGPPDSARRAAPLGVLFQFLAFPDGWRRVLLCVHSRGSVIWRQASAGIGGSQGFPVMASRMASSALTLWAAAESR